MPGHDVIVVGASAGGVETLIKLVRDLPANLPASIFIVLHLPATGPSVMPDILNRVTRLKALNPKDYQKIEYGHIYIAPSNYHLLVHRGYIRLTQGPKENSHRPAVDPLFRTAARAYGKRVVGVVLSGTLDDGTAGLIAIKSRQGVAVVQDPEDALFSGMPKSAISRVKVDYILPVAEISSLLEKLAHEPVAEEPDNPVSKSLELESKIAEFDIAAMEAEQNLGTPSQLSCPSCGGQLWEHKNGQLLQFRCRIGHAWSEESLAEEQKASLEQALWTALRALEENAAFLSRLAERSRNRNQPAIAQRFEMQAEEVKTQALVIRQVLIRNEGEN